MEKQKVIIRALINEPKTFTELLEVTGFTRPTLASHLRKLEDEGIVQSVLDRKDKRRVFYSLSNEAVGLTTISKLIENVKNELKAIGEELTDEEKEKIEYVLKSHIRKVVLDKIINGKPETDPLVLLSVVAMLRDLYKYIKPAQRILELSDNEVRDYFTSVVGDITKDTDDVELMNAVFELPESFASKWVQTKFFNENIVLKTMYHQCKNIFKWFSNLENAESVINRFLEH